MAPTASPTSNRFLRLHSFEIIIFVIMLVLFALCISVVPLLEPADRPPPGSTN